MGKERGAEEGAPDVQRLGKNDLNKFRICKFKDGLNPPKAKGCP